MATRIALIGATGRMGTRIDAIASGDAEVCVALRLGRMEAIGHAVDRGVEGAHESDHGWNRDPATGPAIDVVIDFSSDAGTRRAMGLARDSGAGLLVGTTGLSAETMAELTALARSNPVLVAPNTSLGVAVTRKLARLAAELLGGSGWSVDIVESHHDRKKDAPSGTALALARALEAGGMPVPSERIHAIRAGDTVGEHEVRLAGPSERIHLMHQAVTRDLFATGALRAAKWLHGRPAGSYSMDDVLG